MNDYKILIFQRLIPAYRLPVFKALYEKLDIMVVCSNNGSEADQTDFSNQIDFPHEKARRFWISKKKKIFIQNVFSVLKKHKPKVVLCEAAFGNLTSLLLRLLKPFFGYHFVVWTHGIENHEILNPYQSLRGKLLLKFLNSASGIVFYSQDRMTKATPFLRKNQALFVASNTIDSILYNKIFADLEKKGRQNLRKELNMDSYFNLLYIGRVIPSKRINFIAKVMDLLNSEKTIHLHVIGSGSDLQLLKNLDHQNQIHYHGMSYDIIQNAKYLYCSDLLINPGYLGLSVVETFAFACPVITSQTTKNGPFHSPEIVYVKNDLNGIVIEDDPLIYVDEIVKMKMDRTYREKLSQNARATFLKECSIENFINGFAQMKNYFKEKDEKK